MPRFFHKWILSVLSIALCCALTGCLNSNLDDNHMDDLIGIDGAEGLSPSEPSSEQSLPTTFSLPIQAGETLDPFSAGDGIQQLLTPLLYEGLFELDEQFAPQKLLCSDYTASADFKIWTITLRNDAVFSDGSPLTAADVTASYQQARQSPRFQARFANVESIHADQNGRVVFRLREGNNRFPSLLDIPIVQRSTLGKAAPIGTGPYYYVQENSSKTLQQNPHWPNRASLPLKTISLVTVDESTTLSHLFSGHEIQMVTTDYIGNSPTSYKGAAAVTEAPTTTMQYLGFNCRNGLFTDPALRHAVSLGIDRSSIHQAYFSGHSLSAAFPVSPLSEWYPADLDPGYSAAAFHNAMEKAGYTSGRHHNVRLLVCDGNSFRISAARAIAAALSVYDLKVQLQILPYDAYLEALQSGNFDFYYGEVRMTPDFNCAPLLKTNGSLNYGGFSDPVLDAQITSAFTTSGAPRGSNNAMMSTIRDTAPIVPLGFKSLSVVLQGGVVDAITPTCANPFYQFSQWKMNIKGEIING